MDNQEIKHATIADVYFRKLLNINFDEARRLIKKHGSPLLVLSRKRAADAYLALQRALPGVQIFYAMKSR